jgi:hypothetical protein
MLMLVALGIARTQIDATSRLLYSRNCSVATYD